MGLHRIAIEFEKEVPSFQSISQQYKQQTGWPLKLVATINLVTDELAQLLSYPSELLGILHADSEAVNAIDELYEVDKSRFLLGQEYEAVASARDKTRQAKELLNHVERVEIVVDNGSLCPIDISVEGRKMMVEYEYETYAVTSFVKTMVELGGKYLQGDKLPKSWLKLKQWHEYKWYNRPRK